MNLHIKKAFFFGVPIATLLSVVIMTSQNTFEAKEKNGKLSSGYFDSLYNVIDFSKTLSKKDMNDLTSLSRRIHREFSFQKRLPVCRKQKSSISVHFALANSIDEMTQLRKSWDKQEKLCKHRIAFVVSLDKNMSEFWSSSFLMQELGTKDLDGIDRALGDLKSKHFVQQAFEASEFVLQKIADKASWDRISLGRQTSHQKPHCTRDGDSCWLFTKCCSGDTCHNWKCDSCVHHGEQCTDNSDCCAGNICTWLDSNEGYVCTIPCVSLFCRLFSGLFLKTIIEKLIAI